MNAFSPLVGTAVHTADLSDPQTCARIERFVAVRPDAELFHLPQWSRAVEKGTGQKSHYLIAGDGSGAITGLLPLSEIRSPIFGAALVSAGFAVGGGILALDAGSAGALADAAWALAVKQHCSSVELRGGHLPSTFQRSEGTYAAFAKDLPQGEDAILKAIPRKQRAEVRRALGFGLDVSFGTDAAQRSAHYRVYSESVRNLGTPVFPQALFEAMMDEYGGDAEILTVREVGKPLASVLSFYFKGTVYPYWGGGTAEARGRRTNELLYFELMRRAAAKGCTRFDFGRSKAGTGAFAYKKNWGFEPKPLVYAVRTADGSAPRAVNPLDPKYRLQIALWRKLPLWAANRLGPHIARGLG